MHDKIIIPLIALLLLVSACSKPKVETPVASKIRTPSRDLLVVIDAGHGGEDVGTHSEKNPSYEEKNYTLRTARLLQLYLEELGFKTLMTRSTDAFIPLHKRAEIANEKRAKVFVSVHYNSAPKESAEGIEVFYYDPQKKTVRSQESKLLADLVLRELLQQTHATSRGVKHGNFAVIRETTMPAILVEGGFLTNPEERSRLNKPNYLKKIALGIAYGIDDYLPHA